LPTGNDDGAPALAPLLAREDGLRVVCFDVALDFGLLAVFGFDFDAVAFMLGETGGSTRDSTVRVGRSVPVSACREEALSAIQCE
jgi:hypothetical protein